MLTGRSNSAAREQIKCSAMALSFCTSEAAETKISIVLMRPQVHRFDSTRTEDQKPFCDRSGEHGRSNRYRSLVFPGRQSDSGDRTNVRSAISGLNILFSAGNYM